MNCDPYQVVRDFEAALCAYTGALYAVTTTSCTMALLLACAWHLDRGPTGNAMRLWSQRERISIPKRTYISVPMSIIHAGGWPIFKDEEWEGEYKLEPLPVWDCARWLRGDMYRAGQFMCLSFHWTKQLSLGQGGAILHNDPEADKWLRRARFDGRTEGLAPKADTFDMIGHHCYMSPRDAAEGLSRLATLPKHNDPLPNDDYPDLSKIEVFR